MAEMCVCVFVCVYLCEIDFAGPVMQLSMSLLFSWKLSRLIILTIFNIAEDILLRNHLLIIYQFIHEPWLRICKSPTSS